MRSYLFAALFWAAFPHPIYAQTMPCYARADVVHVLTSGGQKLAAVGQLTSAIQTGIKVELFETKNGANWTLLIAMPDGAACIVGYGVKWAVERGERL